MKRDQPSHMKEVIKIRCPSCKELNPESAKYCNDVASHYNNQLAIHQGIGVRIDVECDSDS